MRIAAWAYLVLALAAWGIIRVGADRWWAATVVMFGPEWLGLLPSLLLLPACLAFRRSSLTVLLVAAVVVLVPVMDLCTPWRALVESGRGVQHVRLVTCNIHRRALDPAAFGSWLGQCQPDVVILQEWSSRFERLFPRDRWHVRRDDELFIASRYPIVSAADLTGGRLNSAGVAVCYELATPSGPVRVINLHLDSPHKAFEAVVERSGSGPALIAANSRTRWRESELIAAAAKAIDAPLLVGGDFNTPGESPIFGSCWSEWRDAFDARGFGFGHTYFSRHNAVRIDHVLFSPAWGCRGCRVGPDVGSPHRPVLAEFELRQGR